MDPVRSRCRDLLRTHGPLTLADVGARLAAEGQPIGEDLDALDEHLFPFAEPEWSPSELADRRLVDPAAALDSLVLTTRLTDANVRDGQPTFSPDLDALLEVIRPGTPIPLAAGGSLRLDLDTDTGTWVLAGPDGWMPGTAGQLLVIRLADGQLHLDVAEPSDVDDLDQDLVDRLATTWDELVDHRSGFTIPDLVLELRVRHPDVLSRPTTPMTELLPAAGLDVYGDWVVSADELDDDGIPTHDVTGTGSPFAPLVDHLVDDHGMTAEQADEFVLLTVLTMGVQLSPPPDLDDEERRLLQLAQEMAGEDPDAPELDTDGLDLQQAVPRLAQILADDDIAEAVPHDLLGHDPSSAGAFAVVARRVARDVRDRMARSNAWWLHAHALEFLDQDGTAVERSLRRALEASGDHVQSAIDLAWCLDDRGQAGAAVGQLVEHGLGDSAWSDDLRAWAAPGPTSARRNDPCPCGSGRKHKVCCEPRNGWPLLDRVDWVYGKLTRFSARPANAELVDLVTEVAGGEPMGRLPDDPVAASASLFEGGLVSRFCDVRGPLLPADELELVRTWQHVGAGAYEVVATDPGAGLTLLDLTTGDRHDVTERTASRRLEPGQVVLTWLVPYPDGTTRVALGAVSVPVHRRPSLLGLLDRDPTALDIVQWAASLSTPPSLANTDGDRMTMCRTVVAIKDAQAARKSLAAVGEDAAARTGRDGAVLEDHEDAFHLLADGPTGSTLIGSVRIEGDTLVLETNSERRIEELQQLVLTAVDTAEVVEDDRTPMAELVTEDGILLEPGAETPTGALDLDDVDDLDPQERQALVEAMDAWIAEQEERWCDQQIPALGGITPRQAAADPTRRPDLEALLAEFPPPTRTPGQPRGMDPGRLRALLGLVD